jgi:hypothetical protein
MTATQNTVRPHHSNSQRSAQRIIRRPEVTSADCLRECLSDGEGRGCTALTTRVQGSGNSEEIGRGRRSGLVGEERAAQARGWSVWDDGRVGSSPRAESRLPCLRLGLSAFLENGRRARPRRCAAAGVGNIGPVGDRGARTAFLRRRQNRLTADSARRTGSGKGPLHTGQPGCPFSRSALRGLAHRERSPRRWRR